MVLTVLPLLLCQHRHFPTSSLLFQGGCNLRKCIIKLPFALNQVVAYAFYLAVAEHHPFEVLLHPTPEKQTGHTIQ